MKTPHRLFSHHLGARFMTVVMAGAFFAPCYLLAAPTNPVSKLYVSDLKGEADLNTADTITALTKKTVFNAEGTTVLTAKNSTDAMVYSNGTGIYLDPDTRLNVKKFVQEPFTPNRYDLDMEPSVSQTQASVSHGLVGLCTSKLSAGSSMVYNTPQAKLSIRGKKLVVEVNNYETRVSVLEGDVTVQSSDSDAGQVLHGGQEAIVRSDAANHTSSIVHVGQIPDDRKQFLDDRASMACIAKKTVYFEVVDKNIDGNPTQEIQAAEVVPTNKPTDFTVSPSQLPQ
ncbi:MAG TPA: FecR domain-containing protein [Opitutaceae bacterium]|nr:FecR domain-containing protein [Opitutaceae bacterium]